VKLAHLADVHLGFRQFHRLTANGINQREVDVAQAFRLAIDGVIEAAPDLVVVAGDLFHSVRPTNTAILDSFNQFQRLRRALPQTPIVLVAGNHDTPRSIETGSILRLFEALGEVHTVSGEPRELTFPALDLSVTCVPHLAWSGAVRPTLVPAGDAAHRIAVTHGVVRGAFPEPVWADEYGGPQLEPGDLHAEEWDYVALGHYHVAHAVRPNAWYAGALEYTSPNIWGELKDEEREGRAGKGWLLVTLGDGRADVAFQPVPSARRVVDLPPVAGALLSPAELDARIAEGVASVEGGLEGQIVRQLVFDVPRPVARDLDHAQIRDCKARALHYHLDVRRPAPTRTVGVGSPGERQTLGEIVADFVGRRPLDADVDRDALVALATEYMQAVGREEAGA
jgi:hypothetical protein